MGEEGKSLLVSQWIKSTEIESDKLLQNRMKKLSHLNKTMVVVHKIHN